MSGIKNLQTLLSQMDPKLSNEEYIFSVKSVIDINSNPFAIICEEEGITHIERLNDSLNPLGDKIPTFRKITLLVHSSLEAVGLTAAIAKVLAEENISCNVVAGYYHDHIFIPTRDALKAHDLLKGLSN